MFQKKVYKVLLFDVIISLILPMQIYRCTLNAIIGQNVIYIGMLLIVLIYIIINRNYIIGGQKKLMYGCFLLSTVVLPIFSFHVDNIGSLLYVTILVVYYFLCDIVGRRFSCNKNIPMNWCILSTIVIDINIIQNINQINADTILGILFDPNSGTIRMRATFGFFHPNFAAVCIVSLLMLYYIILFNERRALVRTALIILFAFNSLALICTGSRTAILAILAFIISEVHIRALKFLQTAKTRFLMNFATLSAMLVIVFQLTDSSIDLSLLSSGRLDRILDGIQDLSQTGHLFLGYTVSSIVSLEANLGNSGILGTDNWYYMQILRYGILGLIIFMFPIFLYLKSVYKRVISNQTSTYYFSAVIMLLIYGVGENVLFNQAIPLTTLIWTIIFSELNLNSLCHCNHRRELD